MSQDQLNSLSDVVFLGHLLKQVYLIADHLSKDEQYERNKAVQDLLSLARDIRDEIAGTQF